MYEEVNKQLDADHLLVFILLLDSQSLTS